MSLPSIHLQVPLKATPKPRQDRHGVMLTFLAFGLLAQVLRFSGNPNSPAWAALETVRQPLDIAIVGDSRAHVGLAPGKLGGRGLFSEGEGLAVYNFAVDGSDALHHASFILQGLLKQEHPPRVVVWASNPLGFNEARNNNRVERLLPADLPMLCKNGAPLETLLEILTGSWFAPYRLRANVAQNVNHLGDRLAWLSVHLQTRVLKLTYTPLAPTSEYFPRESGYVPFKVLVWAARFVRGMADYSQKYEAARLSERHLLAARDILRGALRTGTHVVILEMPVASWFVENLTSRGFHAGWRRRMEVLANKEGATFIQDSAVVGGNEGFGDPGHMSFETSQVYSETLARRLREIPAVQKALGRETLEGMF
jgi:hypothetical protein